MLNILDAKAEMAPYATGANPSPFDLRTFGYVPAKANVKGGTRYLPEDIEDQHSVGICTAISVTQNARKVLGTKFNADFQYLMQKKYRDGNWEEGSSLSSALWVAKNIGLLPESQWKHTTTSDRRLSYAQYIQKLKNIPEVEILRLKAIAQNHKITAYANVPTNRNSLALAIDESKAGILTRYALGREWRTIPIQPLRPPQIYITGHAVTDSNYSGDSFRIANSWGKLWADGGTAYRLHSLYRPTEAWIPYYTSVPPVIEDKLASRETLMGQLVDKLQSLLELLRK